MCPPDPCDAAACDDAFVTGAVCRLGRCAIEKKVCDQSLITCRRLPPTCREGTIPEVDPVGGCYTDRCIPSWACDVVPDCSHCTKDEVCVSRVSRTGPHVRCEPIPTACGAAADCDCAAAACEAPFDLCNDTADGLECACPTC